MATYSINFDFKVSLDWTEMRLQLAPFLVQGTPSNLKVRIDLPTGKIIRSNYQDGDPIEGLDATGFIIYAERAFTRAQVNIDAQTSGSIKTASEAPTTLVEEDLYDGVFKVFVEFTAGGDTYTNTKYFIIAGESKTLILNKLKEMYRTYPQIPYSVMYAGGEKRAMRSLMMLEAAEFEIERNNIDQAKLLVATVVRFVKTWLTK
jgi:hypothetical protein